MANNLFLSFKNKSVGTRDNASEQTKGLIIDMGNLCCLGKVGAEDSEVLGIVDMSKAIEPINAFFDERISNDYPICVEGQTQKPPRV